MKRALLILCLFFASLFASAQSYNPYVNQGIVSPAPLLPLEFNGSGELSFNIGNTGSDPLPLVINQEMSLIITLSKGIPNEVDPLAALGGTWLIYFDWTYDAGITTYTGIQNQEISGSDSGDITIAYKVITNTSSSVVSNGFNINLQPPPYTNGIQSTDDDSVSSYTYVLATDYGDAPASYLEASHDINIYKSGGEYTKYIYLGSSVDPETANQPSAIADGDDTNDTDGDMTPSEDDEDGVIFPSLILGTTVDIPVEITINNDNGSNNGFLNAWIDWNGDDDFDDAGEKIITNQFFFTSGTTNYSVTVPGDAIITQPTFARFRVGNFNIASSGLDDFGEVEDYQVTIQSANSGTISGTVEDDNGNPIPGVILSLDDGNPTTTNLDTTTAIDGSYSFTVIPGDYIIEETQPADYTNVSDGDAIVDGVDDTETNDGSTTNDTIPVSLASGETDSGNDFIESCLVPPTPTVTVSPADCDNGAVVTVTNYDSGLTYTSTASGLVVGAGGIVTGGIDGDIYTITATSAATCTATSANFTFEDDTQLAAPDAPLVTVTLADCDNGAVVTVTNYDSGLTYTSTASGLVVGAGGIVTGGIDGDIYTITAENANTCTATSASFTFEDDTQLLVPTPTVTVSPADCDNGAVVTVTNYDSGLTYTSTASGLVVGAGGIVTGGIDGDIYTITAENANTCTATSASFINDTDAQLAAPDAPLVTVTLADCDNGAVVTVTNYDSGLTYTSTASGLVVGAGGIVTGGIDGDTYTITAENANTCTATSANFINDTDAQLATPDAPLVTVTPADCDNGAVVTVTNYDSGLTYTSTAAGLVVGAGGIVTGGIDGDTYTITATSAATCTATSASFTFEDDTQLLVPTPTVTVSPADCDNGAVVTVTNYDSGLTYTSTASGLVVGAGGIVTGGIDGDIYTITAENTNTCTATSASFTFEDDTQLLVPTPTVTVSPADCDNGAVVTVTNYDSGLTYTSTASGLVVGAGGIVTGGIDGDTYTITAENANTCTATSANFINDTDAQLATPDAPLVTVTPADCDNGAVVTVTNYDSGLTYTSTASGLIVGAGGIVTGGIDGDIYTITAENTNTCTATSASFINDTDAQLAAPDAPLVTVTPADCDNGAVVTVTNYDSGLTYTSTASGLVVGAGGIVTGGIDGDTYTITAENTNTCTATSANFINDTDAQLATPDAPLVTVSPADCDNGAVVTVTNYDSGLTYTSTAAGLIVGAGGIVTGGIDGDTYTITAENANTCTATSANFINDTDAQLATPDAPLVTVSPADCDNGAVVTVTNYDSGLTYTSTAAGLVVGAGGIVTGGIDGDTYTITAENANTCTATSANFINDTDAQLATPDAPLVTVSPADCDNGALVTVTNYDSGLTYTSTAAGLIVGAGGIVTGGIDGDIYTITAENTNTCTATSASFTFEDDTQLLVPTPTVTVSPADCDNGAVVTVTNYDSGLTYTSTASGLVVGAGGIVTGGIDGDIYTITATSAATCTATSANFINDTDAQLAAPDAPLVTVTPADCDNGAVVTVTNYDSGLTYTSTAAGLIVGAGGIVTGGIDGDTYTITAENTNTCTATSANFINDTDAQLATPDAPLVTVTPADCDNGAVVTVTNYDSGLTYTSTAAGLIVGAGGIVTGGIDGDTYTITAENTNTCTATSASFINDTDAQLAAPDAPLVTVTPADCDNGAVVTVTNYDSGLTYTSTASGLVVGAGGIVTGGIDGDTYTITAENANTCTATSANFINDTDAQLAAPDAPLVTVSPADCDNGAVVTVTNYDSGLTYTSTAAGLIVGAGGIVTGGIDGDIYTITAENANTCTATSASFINDTDAQLAAPDAPLVTVTLADCDNGAVVTVTNYDSGLTYTSTAAGLIVGAGGIVTGGIDGDTYTITAENTNTCTATSASFINDTDAQLATPDAPLVTVTPADCDNGAVVTVTNYDSGLTYTSTAAGLIVGAGGIVTGGIDGDTYTITAENANTCTATSANFINDTDAQLATPDAPLVTVSPADCDNGALVTVTNYDSGLTYTSTASGLIVGAGGIVTGGIDGDTYTITAENANTCTATSASFINDTDAQLAAPDAPLVTVTPADCDNGAVVTVTNYDSGLTYTSTASGLVVGAGGIVTGGIDGDIYTITATSAATCTATSASFINDTDAQLAAPDAPLVTVTLADCDNGAVVTVTNYDSGLTYTSTAAGLIVGAGGIVTGGIDGDTYTITAENTNTCTATSANFINDTDAQLATPDAPLVTVTPADCDNGAVVTVTNYDSGLTYTSTAAGLVVGAGGIVTGGIDGDTYTITAENTNTCTATSASFINDTDAQLATPDAPLVTVTPADCDNGAVVTVTNYDSGLTYTSTASGLIVGAGGIVTGGIDGDTYTITAENANTCTATSASFINDTDAQLAAPDAPLVTVTLADCDNGAVVTVTNYDSGLTYTSTAAGLIVGAGGIVTGGIDGDTYTITAENTNTCTATSASFINDTDAQLAAPDAPLVTVTPADCDNGAVVTVTNYDSGLTYTSTAAGLIVGAGGIVTGGIDGDTYTITAENANTCTATSANFINDTDAQLATPDAPLVTVSPADCDNGAVVTVTNYDSGLTYTSTAAGLIVGAGGIVTGGIDGDTYTITAENTNTCTATSAEFTYDDDVQLLAPNDLIIESIDQEVCADEYISIEFEGPIGINEEIEIYLNADLTLVANPATASVTSWQSLDLFTTSGSLWAVLSDSSTSCNSNVLEIPFTVSDCADLTITKAVSNNSPNVGDTIDFVITVTNLGASNATGVIIEELLPSGYDSSTATIVASAGIYDLVTGNWSIPLITSGTSETLTLTVAVNSEGNYTNCASITSLNEIDPDQNNNIACVSVDPVYQSDLEIIKIVSNDITYVGDTVQFTIALMNNGPSNASGVTVMELLPSGYTFISSNVGPDYNEITGIWYVDNIINGETLYLNITTRVNATGEYMNCAEVLDSNIVDPDPTNNSDCTETNPIPLIDLSVIKVADDMNPEPEDDEITFTITVTNDGPSDATGVEIIDVLASGYEFISSFAEVGLYDENTGIWTIGTVPNNITYYLDITVLVLPTGEYLNTTEVISANEEDIDSTPDNSINTEDDYSEVLINPIVIITIPDVITANDDGVNDVFDIDNLEALYPNYKMEIYNRWGNQVYDYTHNGNSSTEPLWWNGYSDGRWNIAEGERLPTSTYYYIIYFNDGNRKPQTGWVYLNR